jgi:hypothetical protein
LLRVDIVVARLLQIYDPYPPICPARPTREQILGSPVEFNFESMYSSRRLPGDSWHLGRIRYFYQFGIDEPILLSVHERGDSLPVVLDGHHRLCAADLREDWTIPADCDWDDRWLSWLTGFGEDPGTVFAPVLPNLKPLHRRL